MPWLDAGDHHAAQEVAHMTEEPTTTEPTPEPEPAEPEPTVDPPEPQEVGSLPDWTQKMIKDLRSKAADKPTKTTKAEQTRKETMDANAKALGMKDDDDPA